MKERLKEYFYFSKLERAGVISLLILIVLLVIGRLLLFEYYAQTDVDQKDISKIDAKIDSIKLEQSKKESRERRFDQNQTNLKDIQDFNPNTLGIDGWKEFGLSEKQAKSLLNYKELVGGFKSKEQFKRVYVISAKIHEQLAPHIILPETVVDNLKEFPKWENKKYEKYEKKVRAYPKIDINEADTASFKRLYGIGDFLADMIVKRREELGGFVSKDQLKEVYGLKEETLTRLDTQLVFVPTKLRKLSINTATKEELKAHPYLYWKHANAIVNYRKQHGEYKALDELKKIVLINDSIFQKVKPYLEL
jgi:competence ComEA-like helix-hairpin-helix protein